jgi:hypothetical protein
MKTHVRPTFGLLDCDAMHSEDGSSKVLRKVGNLSYHYMISPHKKPRLQYSSPWKTKFSQNLYRLSQWLYGTCLAYQETTVIALLLFPLLLSAWEIQYVDG